MTHIKRMTNGMNARRLGRENRRAATAFTEGIYASQLIGAARERLFWYKRPAAPKLIATGTRVTIGGAELTPYANALAVQAGSYVDRLVPGSYEWAKAHAHESATAYVGLNLHRPKFSTNWGTAHFAGKPYHWRQDYTGQLKLAAGESPW